MPISVTINDVETWLVDNTAVDTFDADVLQRVIDTVIAHAGRHYDLADISAGLDTERDQALIMEAGRLYERKHTTNGYVGADELGAVRVTTFDPDVRRLLAGRLRTAGIFGPSENTEDDDA